MFQIYIRNPRNNPSHVRRKRKKEKNKNRHGSLAKTITLQQAKCHVASVIVREITGTIVISRSANVISFLIITRTCENRWLETIKAIYIRKARTASG